MVERQLRNLRSAEYGPEPHRAQRGINISDVRGQIRFEGRNGGVHLKRLAGDVSGSTANGGVQAELTGTTWDGRQLEVRPGTAV